MEPRGWDRKAFGRRLKKARQDKDMTQDAVAEMLRLKTKQAVSHWETGTNIPRVDQVARLAAEYQVDLAWLLLGADAPAIRFTPEVAVELSKLAPDELRRAENAVRTYLELAPLARPRVKPQRSMSIPARIYSWRPAAAMRNVSPPRSGACAEVIQISSRWGCEWGLF